MYSSCGFFRQRVSANARLSIVLPSNLVPGTWLLHQVAQQSKSTLHRETCVTISRSLSVTNRCRCQWPGGVSYTRNHLPLQIPCRTNENRSCTSVCRLSSLAIAKAWRIFPKRRIQAGSKQRQARVNI